MKPTPIELLMARITRGRYRPAPMRNLAMVLLYLVGGWIALGLFWLAIIVLFSV